MQITSDNDLTAAARVIGRQVLHNRGEYRATATALCRLFATELPVGSKLSKSPTAAGVAAKGALRPHLGELGIAVRRSRPTNGPAHFTFALVAVPTTTH